MTDRELIDRLKQAMEHGRLTPLDYDAVEQGAARLDRLRWRSVDEGLPEPHKRILIAWRSHEDVCVAWGAAGEFFTHLGRVRRPDFYCYVDPPGAEGGGE